MRVERRPGLWSGGGRPLSGGAGGESRVSGGGQGCGLVWGERPPLCRCVRVPGELFTSPAGCRVAGQTSALLTRRSTENEFATTAITTLRQTTLFDQSFPERTLCHHCSCSVTLLQPEGGNTKRNSPQVYIKFPDRCRAIAPFRRDLSASFSSSHGRVRSFLPLVPEESPLSGTGSGRSSGRS